MNYENLKNIAETLAILAAGIYFLYKFIDGWLEINMTVDSAINRHQGLSGEDQVAVGVKLKKGDKGTLRIITAQLRVTFPENSNREPITEEIRGFKRKTLSEEKINWDQSDDRKYRITPNEELHLASYIKVPSEQVCVIEIIVIALRDFHLFSLRPAQWRSTHVSLPIKHSAKKNQNGGS